MFQAHPLAVPLPLKAAGTDAVLFWVQDPLPLIITTIWAVGDTGDETTTIRAIEDVSRFGLISYF